MVCPSPCWLLPRNGRGRVVPRAAEAAKGRKAGGIADLHSLRAAVQWKVAAASWLLLLIGSVVVARLRQELGTRRGGAATADTTPGRQAAEFPDATRVDYEGTPRPRPKPKSAITRLNYEARSA